MQKSIVSMELFSVQAFQVLHRNLTRVLFYFNALLLKYVQYLILLRHFTFPKHYTNTS